MSEIQHPVVKAVAAASSSLAGLVASTSAPVEAAKAAVADGGTALELLVRWGPLAVTLLGGLYTLTLWWEWWWKRFWRPLAIRRGWWDQRNPYFRDDSAATPLDGKA